MALHADGGKMGECTLEECMRLSTLIIWLFVGGFAAGATIANPCYGETLIITADMQFAYALSAQEEGEYETAMVEWKRFLHFFPSDSRQRGARFNLGVSLFHLNKLDKAGAIFHSLRYPYVGSVQNIESFFMLSRTLTAQGRKGGAERVLRDLLSVGQSPEIKDRALWALAWIYLDRTGDMEPGALEKAKAFLGQISPEGEARLHVGDMKTAVDRITGQTKKSPRVAGLASVVPGGGFAYCERYRDALAALLINAALVFAAHESFGGGNDVLGGLICLIEAGFYGGNIYGGISSAHKFNRAQIRQELNRIRHLHNAFAHYENDVIGSVFRVNNPVFKISFQIPF